jgi:hypothetical protein
VSELALDGVQRDPSRAISTACAWRSWCGAKCRREEWPDRELGAQLEPWLQLLPRPFVHADFAAWAALAASDQERAAAAVEIELGERQRFVAAQPGAPEDDD